MHSEPNLLFSPFFLRQLPQQIERIVNLTEFNFFIMDIVKARDFERLDVACHSMFERNLL